MARMKLLVVKILVLLLAAGVATEARAQTAVGEKVSDSQLATLVKKIDEQNLKIDALSQQLLKLEQQIAAIRPGVMIGEATPVPTTSSSATTSTAAAPVPDSGNAHVVTKGETLTSIAKAHKVGVQDLQKFNHIENDRALQIGQTIMIPSAGSSPPAASPSASPNE